MIGLASIPILISSLSYFTRKAGESAIRSIFSDVLKMEGTDQVGFPLRERLGILNGLPLSGKISVAHSYAEDLTGLYRGLTNPLDEGIVLKDPEAVLAECHRDGLNANWQVKCRRGTKNFGF